GRSMCGFAAATLDISAKISGMQGSTDETIVDIGRISGVISEGGADRCRALQDLRGTKVARWEL
ncbi:MAG: hypothetical protein WCL50_18605, partial [Spirochaetota bacterium]